MRVEVLLMPLTFMFGIGIVDEEMLDEESGATITSISDIFIGFICIRIMLFKR